MTATCANDARRESRDSDPHKINYCPSIITSRTSCTSPTRRKIKGKKHVCLCPFSVSPANYYSKLLFVGARTAVPSSEPPLALSHRTHPWTSLSPPPAHLARLYTRSQPWTLPACGTGSRRLSTRMPPLDSKPSSISSMCVSPTFRSGNNAHRTRTLTEI